MITYGAPLKTQVMYEAQVTPAQIQEMSTGMPPTTRAPEGYPREAAIPARPQTSKAFPRWLILAGVGGVIIVLLVVATVVSLALSGGRIASKTATAGIENTMVARVQGTSTKMAQDVVNKQASATAQAQVSIAQNATAEFQASRTALAVSTAAAKAQRTSTSRARSQATDQALTSFLASLGINATPKLKYGPVSGRLVHDPSDSYIEGDGPDYEIKNFLVQVDLFAPFSITRGEWDYGIGFRDIGKNEDYRVILLSDKTWRFEKGLDMIANGNAPGLKVGENESNLIQLVAMDAQGWLFVNGTQIARLNLSALPNAGTVWVGTGFYSDDEKAGESTRYSDFTIWELP